MESIVNGIIQILNVVFGTGSILLLLQNYIILGLLLLNLFFIMNIIKGRKSDDQEKLHV